ncbi:YraN family protein [bacterium]|nr:YraN family protein [bacterium]
MTTKEVGTKAEQEIQKYLIQNGYTVLACNYRTFFGEIDIIAQHKNVLSFIEVKLRNSDFLPIGHIVHPGKQQKIIKTAQHYLMTHAQPDTVYRFDIAYIDKHNTITYIQNAFIDSQNEW